MFPRTIEYYEGRLQILMGRHKENARIIRKIERKLRNLRASKV